MLYKEYRPLNGLYFETSSREYFIIDTNCINRKLCMPLVLAAELLNALENSIRGQSINLEIILKNCNSVVESGEDNDVRFIFLNSNLIGCNSNDF